MQDMGRFRPIAVMQLTESTRLRAVSAALHKAFVRLAGEAMWIGGVVCGDDIGIGPLREILGHHGGPVALVQNAQVFDIFVVLNESAVMGACRAVLTAVTVARFQPVGGLQWLFGDIGGVDRVAICGPANQRRAFDIRRAEGLENASWPAMVVILPIGLHMGVVIIQPQIDRPAQGLILPAAIGVTVPPLCRQRVDLGGGARDPEIPDQREIHRLGQAGRRDGHLQHRVMSGDAVGVARVREGADQMVGDAGDRDNAHVAGNLFVVAVTFQLHSRRDQLDRLHFGRGVVAHGRCIVILRLGGKRGDSRAEGQDSSGGREVAKGHNCSLLEAFECDFIVDALTNTSHTKQVNRKLSIRSIDMSERPILFHPILHAAAVLEERLRERLAPLGITPRQARILVALDRLGAASQAVLADEFQVKAASMSTMTSRLIANGFINRQMSVADKRANALELTEDGRAFLKEVHRAWGDIDGIIEQVMGTEVARAHSKQALKLLDALNSLPSWE